MTDVQEPDAAAESKAEPAEPEQPAPRRARASRWDRPKEPHDWRWVVGLIGKSLIILGLLMFGFVAYQLWGTGLQTARAQNALDSEFDAYLEEAGITPDTIAPATTPIEPTAPSTPDATASPSVPGSTEPPSAPTTTAPDTTTSIEPVDQDYPEVHPGDAVARIKIPSIGVDYKVVAGVSVKDLAKGPGHFPNTPLPGQVGNSAIAAHRTGHGGPFEDLDQLHLTDDIEIYTAIGGAYVYDVTSVEVVGPGDYHVVTDSVPGEATLTLITCTPKYTSEQRLVVRATLDTTRSSDVGSPELFYGQAPTPVDSTLPPDETLAPVVVETLPDETVPAGAETTTPESTTPAPVTTAAESGGGAAPSEFEVDDAFSQGWFNDGAAWPHVLFWALVLVLIVYWSFFLAKRQRKLWLGILVGTLPFIVALYFFYENVNRLLPAAI